VKGDVRKIYVATSGAGLMVTDSSGRNDLEKIPLESGSGILWNYHAQTIEFDKFGDLWVFVQGIGISKYESPGNSFFRYPKCSQHGLWKKYRPMDRA
jgi:hypothetical protein